VLCAGAALAAVALNIITANNAAQFNGFINAPFRF
jgi:hypothetical protein